MENPVASPSHGLARLAASLKLSSGQRNIALIQFAIDSVAKHFTNYSVDDMRWLSRVLSSIQYPDPPVRFSEIITAQEVGSYLDFQGHSLPGLRLASDGGHAPIWQECAPENTQQQIAYIQHNLLPRLAQNTIETIATLTPDRASEIRVSVVRALPELAEILVALDVQNENSRIKFDQRPNPHIDLFGDTCRDVLKRRISIIAKLIYEP